MTDVETGLRSEALRAALDEALAGRCARLAELLARHGGLPGPRPNLALAAAFGEALARAGNGARRVLEVLALDEAKPDTARDFLPIAAAFGAVARLDVDGAHAWDALFELASDDRAVVRVGLVSAFGGWLARTPANVDVLVARGDRWIEHPDREHRFAACAIVLDVIAAERRRVDASRDRQALLAWVERVIAEIARAPRAAERSPARRRILAALPGALVEIASSMRGHDEGMSWLVARLAEARHPDLRVAMEHTIDGLRRGGQAQGGAAIQTMRTALASSAKPPRDPSRIRLGMSGRGKKGGTRSR